VRSAIIPLPSKLNLYAHIAFCEFLCPFCHYETTHTSINSNTSVVSRYVDALIAEGTAWRDIFGDAEVQSLYIGGGTPTALRTEDLLRILARFAGTAKSPHAEVCVESSPATVAAPGGLEKLDALRAAGVTRISIGVQTFDSALLKKTRGHTAAVAHEAVSRALASIDVANVDLIQDLPEQSDASLVDDITWLERHRPPQVTWYVLRLRPEAKWYDGFAHGTLQFVSDRQSLIRRLAIREGMRRAGYVAQPGGRFASDESLADKFKKIRAGLDETLIGAGVGAYSHTREFFFQNVRSGAGRNGASEYVEEVGRARLPIKRGRRLTPTDWAASTVVRGIRHRLRLPEPNDAIELYLGDVQDLLTCLRREELVTFDSGEFRLTEMGALFEEEICSLFYPRDVQDALRARAAFWRE
jgi:oxygen-independent coproporphyrinogen-3 oxidase